MAELTREIGRELYASLGEDIIIPDIYTSIGAEAFASLYISSVEIGSNISTIGEQAFRSNSLTTVVIPDSVTSVGDWAFESNQLTSIEIGSGVVSVGDYAFRANDLTSVVIPDNVASIGMSAFSGNQITSVEIGNGVTSIDQWAFQNNQITNVEFGDGVTSIGLRAFAGNQLTSIVLPESVTSIGDYAFTDNDLKSVFIPDSVRSIGKWSFYNNPNLESVSVPLKLRNKNLGFTHDVRIDIRDSPPTDIELTALAFDENIAHGSTIATLNSVDDDLTDTHSYTLVSGEGSEDNEFFEIDGNALKIKESPDFESKSSYIIRVETEDSSGGLTFEKSFQLTVRDVEVEVPDLNGDGFVDGITHYQLWAETGGIDLVIGSRVLSDNFSDDWDAVKAIPYRSGYAVLIVSEDRSRTTAFNVLFATSYGRVVDNTEWRTRYQMHDIGCEELFELDFNGNGVIDII